MVVIGVDETLAKGFSVLRDSWAIVGFIGVSFSD